MYTTQQEQLSHERDAIEEAIRNAIKGAGKVNILVAGKTGVGKSTLINTVFRGDLAETGSGRPVTQNTQEITKPGHPLTILDTKGLELKDFAEINETLEKELRDRAADFDGERHIHAAWVCIHEDGRRVEEAEINLCKLLGSYKVPVIVVITKARNDQNFSKEVRDVIKQACEVVRVRAVTEEIEVDEERIFLPVKGIDDLIAATAKYIPEAQQRAYANALSSKNQEGLKQKKKQAEREVNMAAGLAGTAAAVPIPFSDAFALVPIQVGMLTKIGITYGMEVSTAAITTMVGSIIGSSAATLIGRAFVTNALKLIPGVGSAAGGALAATTAVALTKALGAAYIAVLHDFCEQKPGAELDIELITSELKRRMKFS
ncbi:GTPase family protein [Pseudomonas sp. NY11955]|uniref:GTPase family protein n=1 Tax=Pseudomonas sp. NY11955 TaxID=3400363 RepID=UPI003A83EAA4